MRRPKTSILYLLCCALYDLVLPINTNVASGPLTSSFFSGLDRSTDNFVNEESSVLLHVAYNTSPRAWIQWENI